LTDQYFTDAREKITVATGDQLTAVNAIVLKYNDLRLSNSIASDPHSECQTAHKAFRLLDLWRWEQTEDWNLEGRCGNDELSELEEHARTHGNMCDGWRELGIKRQRI
jgi:hypothetical protein